MPNLTRPLRAPWTAATVTQRAVGLGFYGLTLLVTVFSAGFVHEPDAGLHGLNIMVMGCGYASACLLPNSLLLARTARHMRLPHAEREIIFGLLSWMMLGVALPMLPLGLMGANLALVLAVELLAVGMGLYYSLGSTWSGLVIIAVWFGGIGTAGKGVLQTWEPLHPGYVTLASGAAALLLGVMIVLRWLKLVRITDILAPSRQQLPLVLRWQVRRLQGTAGSGWTMLNPGQGVRGGLLSKPSAEPDLRHVGPRRIVPSLRIALGGSLLNGVLLPRGTTARLRQVVRFTLAALFMVLFFVVINTPLLSHPLNVLRDLRTDIHPGSWLFLILIISAMYAFQSVRTLRTRWNRNNGERPLLALLPGLGQGNAPKYALLRATLLPLAALEAVLLLTSVALIVLLHVPGSAAWPLLAMQVAASGWIFIQLPAIFSAQAPEPWAGPAFLIVGMLWAVLYTLGLPGSGVATGTVFMHMLGYLALGCLLIVLALGLHHWRVFKRRAHPFLSH